LPPFMVAYLMRALGGADEIPLRAG
jgi:hypothetical protein